MTNFFWAYRVCYLSVLPSTVRFSGRSSLISFIHKCLLMCTPERCSRDLRDVQPEIHKLPPMVCGMCSRDVRDVQPARSK